MEQEGVEQADRAGLVSLSQLWFWRRAQTAAAAAAAAASNGLEDRPIAPRQQHGPFKDRAAGEGSLRHAGGDDTAETRPCWAL